MGSSVLASVAVTGSQNRHVSVSFVFAQVAVYKYHWCNRYTRIDA